MAIDVGRESRVRMVADGGTTVYPSIDTWLEPNLPCRYPSYERGESLEDYLERMRKDKRETKSVA